MSADDKYAKQKAEAIAQIANVSKLLRDAIAASLPVGPEQYLTIAVPGATIDTRSIDDGGTFLWNARDGAFPPTQVMQAEAKLVDSMVPLSNVMIGNTGKSVARSYARALDCLVARSATISTGADGVALRSPGQPTYDDAMKYLTTPDADNGLTKVDLYVQKQVAWASAQEAWDKAKIDARKESAVRFPNDVVRQLQDFNDWNQAHYRTFKSAVQGRYIDWVTNGYKYSVEQNFGTIDIDSIMARIEQSKESLRNSTIVDEDGVNEVNIVHLTPKNWASLCKLKEDGWYEKNGDYTVDQLRAEIGRLNRLLISYKAMGLAMGFPINADLIVGDPDLSKVTYPIDPPVAEPDTKTAEKSLEDAFGGMYVSSAKLASEEKRLAGKSADEKGADAEWKKANDELNAARLKFRSANDEQQKAQSDYTKYAVASMTDDKSKAAIKSWLSDILQRTKANIDKLEQLQEEKGKKQPPYPNVISGANAKDPNKPGDDAVDGTSLAVAGDENPDPRFGTAQAPAAIGAVVPRSTSSTRLKPERQAIPGYLSPPHSLPAIRAVPLPQARGV